MSVLATVAIGEAGYRHLPSAAEGNEAPQEATEVWTFTRSRGGNWLVSAIQQA